MIRTEKLEFQGAEGAKLAARLDRPVGALRGTALFAHCFTCSKDLRAVRRISQELALRGFAVLRFDFTGLGHSEGEFANTNFSSNVGDIVAAAAELRERGMAPELLVGHSLGGAAVLAAARHISEARAVATIGAPSDPAHVAKLFSERREEIRLQGHVEIELAGRRFLIRQQFLEDLESQNLRDAVSGLKKPLLVMHAPLDTTVGIENASDIFGWARHPKSFISLDSADHLLTDEKDAEFAAGVIAAWATRALPQSPEPPRGDAEEVVVRDAEPGRYAQDVLAGRHSLRSDEPKSLGGDDTGMTPYGLLLAAVGACTSMTMRMYAKRKDWPLDEVEVRLKHQKIHVRDCETCETESGKIDRIEKTVSMSGDLTEEQKTRLFEIADRCPVHRTLHAEVQIVTARTEPEHR